MLQAREKAAFARRLVRAGALAVRRAEQPAMADGESFGTLALTLIDTVETGFRNETHRAQWRTTLTTDAEPIWNKRLTDVETDDLLACVAR